MNTQDLTPTRPATHRRHLRPLLMLAALVAATFGATAAAPERAEAWTWNPQVTLQGRAIVCSSAATWVWVEGSNGERGWATQPRGNYHFTFRRVPANGMRVTVKLGNRACTRQATITLRRPNVGTTATVNVVTIH